MQVLPPDIDQQKSIAERTGGMGRPIAFTFMTKADRAAADAMNAPRRTVRDIAAEVCGYTGHSVTAVMGNSRLAHDCRVRELVCYIAQRRGMTLTQIGRAFHRDHTTIMHAIENETRRRGELKA